jgi:hypothetical protein
MDGSGETLTSPPPVTVTPIPVGPPPPGYSPSMIAVRALLNWIQYGSISGPLPPVPIAPDPPTANDIAAASDLAQRLQAGRATITLLP